MDNGTLLLNNTSYSGNGGTLVVNGISYSGGTSESGGGTDVSDTTAIEHDVKQGKIFHLSDGSRAVGTNTDVDISDTTAEAGDVLSGHFFYTKDGVKTLGQYRPPVVPALTSKDVRVNSLEDAGVISGTNFAWNVITYGLAEEERVKIIPENIKKDVTILGVTGTLEEQSGGYTQFATGSVKCSTSVNTNVDVGFRPRYLIYIQASSTTSAPTNYMVYDENLGNYITFNGGTTINLPFTGTNRIADITDSGFIVSKVTNASTIGTGIYWAFG